MDADRPIIGREDDRLGFGSVAESLAKIIADETAKDGFVFGIEGRWGSGKSTLINLTIAALRERFHEPPEIVEFSPWLIGARDDLLLHLFNELAIAAIRIEPVATQEEESSWWRTWWSKLRGDNHTKFKRKEKLKKDLGDKLSAFGRVAGGLSKLAKTVSLAGVPYAEYAGNILENVGTSAETLLSSASITKRKAELVDALRLLSRRIVVFVDDLDRLEPREANEVLRLIRAVADFPNVIYVLSFDPDVSAKTIEKAVQINDGYEYLKKIVQVSFRIPRPEAFDLRSWFSDEVRKLFPEELSQISDDYPVMNQRLAQVIDIQGGRYLNTPRDVVRALNSLRLHAIPVRGHVDIPDIVWLQLVRLGSPYLYAWIEEYLTEVSAIYRGAELSEEKPDKMGRRLDEILADEGFDKECARLYLAEILPGISTGHGFGNERDAHFVFRNLGRETFRILIRDRRLGSPDHYRYYFAFIQPSGSLSDQVVDDFITLAQEDPEAAIQMFASLARQNRPQGGVMAEVLVERIAMLADRIPKEAVPGILASFAAMLDSAELTSRDSFGTPRAWLTAELAVDLFMKDASPEIRAECIRRVFVEGRALGWATGILRSEIFKHGHYGDRAVPEHERLFKPDEFKTVLHAMLRRYKEAPPDELMEVPNFLSLLFGWMQGAGNEDVREWVQENTQTDSGLLKFLSRARGWVSGSLGVQYPIRRKDLSHFLDYESALERVKRIFDDPKSPSDMRQLAKELIQAFQLGEKEW